MFSRVTNSMMTNTFIRDIQRNLTSTYELQHQISTGKKVIYPSDDPISADRILDYRQIIDATDQYVRNIDDADSMSNNIDGVLGHMEDMLLRVRDLAVSASNEAPENQQMLNAIGAEIDSLLNELVFQSNQKFDGKYLFSGHKTETTPFTAKTSMDFAYNGAVVAANGATALAMPTYTINGQLPRTSDAITGSDSVTAVYINGNAVTLDAITPVDPNTNMINIADVGAAGLNAGDTIEIQFNKVVSVTYNGDTGVREYEIADGSRVAVSYVGAVSDASTQPSVFGKYSADKTELGSVEAFQKLMDLRDRIYKYTNVGADNIEQIMQGIDDVEDIRNNITDVRAEQGGRANRLELAKNRHENVKLFTQDLKAKREEVDMAEAISNLMMMQNVYQAALGTGARIIQTTLLDFLR